MHSCRSCPTVSTSSEAIGFREPTQFGRGGPPGLVVRNGIQNRWFRRRQGLCCTFRAEERASRFGVATNFDPRRESPVSVLRDRRRRSKRLPVPVAAAMNVEMTGNEIKVPVVRDKTRGVIVEVSCVVEPRSMRPIEMGSVMAKTALDSGADDRTMMAGMGISQPTVARFGL